VIGYIGTITNITESKQLEKERLIIAKELAQQKTRTEEAEFYRRQQEQFIDMICHEIRYHFKDLLFFISFILNNSNMNRNPLTGIDGNADLLKDTLQILTHHLNDQPLAV